MYDKSSSPAPRAPKPTSVHQTIQKPVAIREPIHKPTVVVKPIVHTPSHVTVPSSGHRPQAPMRPSGPRR